MQSNVRHIICMSLHESKS